ncbi:MAG TPA: hypothetical protein VGF16_16710 [Bryobacteraceae bacterium]|jgi:hypothetical protein
MSRNLTISFATPLTVIHEQARPSYRAVFAIEINNLQFKGENMDGTMQAGTLATLSVAWTDKGGNPAKVDGPTTWQSSDDTIVTVTPSTGNPLIANLNAPGPIGTVQIHATADADMGSGVQTVTATSNITVISGQAVAGEITFTQSPQQKPPIGPGPNPPAKGGQATPPAKK